jgi:DNA-binding beta-propeller fold protein YncE
MPLLKRRRALGCLMVAAAAVLLAGCAETPVMQGRPKNVLVYPPPPDEPRFYFEQTIYGSQNVAPAEESQLRMVLTGEAVSGESMAKPYAIAVHKGRIFVSDSADPVIRVFDVPTKKYFKIGEEEPGALRKPFGLDVDADGNLYVADGTARTIMVYDRDGKFQRRIGSSKWFDRLSSVTVDSERKRLYVTDIGGVDSQNHRVRVFDAVKGDHLMDIGQRGRGDGQFNLPRDAAVGKDGRLYVVDGGNFRVQVFDRDGKFLKSFGKVGKAPGTFARPKEVATDPDGNVYVVDTAFGNFQIFNPEGELLMFIGDRSERDGPGLYMLPSGIYVDEDGRVYFVDQWYRKVDIYRPARIQENEGYLAAGVAAPASAAATSAPAAATPAVAPVPPGAATAVPAK